MAKTKISQLPDATLPLSGSELVEGVQDGVNVKIPTSEFGGSTSTPNLQEVTDVGAETTNAVIVRQDANNYIELGNGGYTRWFTDIFGAYPEGKLSVIIGQNEVITYMYEDDGLGNFIPSTETYLGSAIIYVRDILNENAMTLTPTNFVKEASGIGYISTLPNQNNLLINGSVVVSSSITTVNGVTFNVVANATLTDPTPVEGMGYMVNVINGTATIGGVGYTVGQKVFRHYHSGSWRSFVYLDKTIIDTLLANKIDYLIKDFTFSPVTGVTSETLVESYEITSGKIGLNDFLNGFIYTTRTGLSNAYTVTLKANTVNNSSTATTIASMTTPGNFVPFLPMKFELTVKGGVIIGAIIEQTQGTNYKGQSSGVNVAFNNTSNSVYLFLFVTPTNTSSVVRVESFKLTK